MAVEEIKHILQTVTEKQAELADAQKANGAQLVELREIVKQIAVAYKSIVELISLHERRLDEHDSTKQATDDKLSALINAQVGLEDRQAKLDEIAKRIAESHGSIVELISLHEKRLDGHDSTEQATDDKLNVLINAQVGLEDRQAKLGEVVRQVAESHGAISELLRFQEKRLDEQDVATQAINGKLNALIDAHVGLEGRQTKIEESHLLLVQLAGIQEKRINGHDEAFRHTNGKLDALMKPARKAVKAAKKKPRS